MVREKRNKVEKETIEGYKTMINSMRVEAKERNSMI